MGIFDFVKEAGESLFGGRDAKPEKPEQTAEALSGRVRDLGLGVDGLRVKVQDERAVLEGRAASQADREKAILAVGNTPGIAQVEDHLEVAKAEPESQYYRVVRGDSLSKIAAKFYGKAHAYRVIFEANQPMLKDPDKIYPGQVLRIPPLEE